MSHGIRIGWFSTSILLVAATLVAGGVYIGIDQYYKELTIRHLAAVPRPHPSPALQFRFPDGRRTVFPGQRLVALYGTPGAPVLGVLGRQELNRSIKVAKKLSAQYQPYSSEKILPTFEIIATIASSTPTDNGDYSSEVPYNVLEQWINTARDAGVYVILDLQPGRTDFLTQAKRIKPLLLQPNVGLALDPEWRLKPNQIPLVQIGTVSIQEVNAVATWLATQTRNYHLPQKVFLLHQFRTDMLPARQQLVTTHPELATVIQMDGQGNQPQKQDTWRAILRNPPANARFGWKNFYLKDTKLLTPKQTMSIKPKPWYVSYQ